MVDCLSIIGYLLKRYAAISETVRSSLTQTYFESWHENFIDTSDIASYTLIQNKFYGVIQNIVDRHIASVCLITNRNCFMLDVVRYTVQYGTKLYCFWLPNYKTHFFMIDFDRFVEQYGTNSLSETKYCNYILAFCSV